MGEKFRPKPASEIRTSAPTPILSQDEPLYTLGDLEFARGELKVWQRRLDTDTSNNPNKFRASTRAALRKVKRIEEALKEAGFIDLTEEEKLDHKLDELYPNAESRMIVTHDGQRYQIRYFLSDVSRSGKTVHEWGHHWKKIEQDPKK